MYSAEKAKCNIMRRKRSTHRHARIVICILIALMLTGCGNKENVQQVEKTVEEELTQESVARETEQINETQESEQNKSEVIEEYMNSLINTTLAVDCSKSYDATELGLQIELVSERPDVVEVSGTYITAKAPGLVEITCTVEGQTKSFEVVVTQPEINTTDIVKTVGQSEQIWFYGTEGKPIFKSENPAIASVSEDGIITAEPTGIGQSTNILAEVDGKEFICKVTVEAIPQLQSMYKLVLAGDAHVGYTEDGKTSKFASWNAEISNIATQVVTYKDVGNVVERSMYGGVESVYFVPKLSTFSTYSEEDYVNLGDTVFPLYPASVWDNTESVQIVLAGTSQKANVWVKEMERMDENGEPIWKEARCTANYIPCDGYGIIELSDFTCSVNSFEQIYFYVWIEIGDYQTRLCVAGFGPRLTIGYDEENGVYDAKFSSDEPDAAILSFNVYDEFMREAPKASDIEERQAALESQNANSPFGYIQSDFLGAIGEEMQNQAIEKIASIALKALLGF